MLCLWSELKKTSWASLWSIILVLLLFFNFLSGDRLILDALIKLEYYFLPILGFLEGIILKILRWLLRIANIGSTWSKMSCTCPVIACLELVLIPLICSPFKWPSLKGSRCCDSKECHYLRFLPKGMSSSYLQFLPKGMSLSSVSTKNVSLNMTAKMTLDELGPAQTFQRPNVKSSNRAFMLSFN